MVSLSNHRGRAARRRHSGRRACAAPDRCRGTRRAFPPPVRAAPCPLCGGRTWRARATRRTLSRTAGQAGHHGYGKGGLVVLTRAKSRTSPRRVPTQTRPPRGKDVALRPQLPVVTAQASSCRQTVASGAVRPAPSMSRTAAAAAGFTSRRPWRRSASATRLQIAQADGSDSRARSVGRGRTKPTRSSVVGTPARGVDVVWASGTISCESIFGVHRSGVVPV